LIGIFGEDKRKNGIHQKREIDVEIHIPDRRIGKVFSIDISCGGLRVAGIGLNLNIGEKVNFSVAMMGDKYKGEGFGIKKGPTEGNQKDRWTARQCIFCKGG